MTALEYIQGKRLEYKLQSGQIVLKECPFCGDHKSHFYMDQKEGQFKCHKCNETGNLFTLQKHFGDYQPASRNGNGRDKSQDQIKQAFPSDQKKALPNDQKALDAHRQLMTDKDALAYLTEARGIGLEAIEFFKLGLRVEPNGRKWLSIPHYFKDKLQNIKYRSLPPAEKTFRRIEGCPSILFNSDAIEGAQELFLCEGEIDSITLWRQGIKNVIGATTGAGSFDPAWIDQLAKVSKIYICYDQDEAGQKGAREVARRLGYDRCFNVSLPDGQDVNDYFKEHDIFEFQAPVNEARQFDVAGIMSFQDGLKKFKTELSKPEQNTGIQTEWETVNKLIRTGFQPGDLVILSAPPKTGKTSFALQAVTFNALQGTPGLFFCLEMRPMRIIHKIIQSETMTDSIGPDQITIVQESFRGKPLYLGYCYTKPDLNGIIETLRAAIKRYGLKFVVFDHLHFLCRSISNQVQEVGLAVQAFKFLAEEMEVPIILIAQPRKIQPGSIMTAQDLKDSSSIFSDCDHLIILHRERIGSTGKEAKEGNLHDQAYDPVTLVRVEASRYGPGGEGLLYFRGECSHFEETNRR